MQADVIAVLKQIDEALVPASTFSLRIGEVKDFSSLAAASQTEGVPFFDVDQTTDLQRTESSEAFNKLASAIVKRTSKPASV